MATATQSPAQTPAPSRRRGIVRRLPVLRQLRPHADGQHERDSEQRQDADHCVGAGVLGSEPVRAAGCQPRPGEGGDQAARQDYRQRALSQAGGRPVGPAARRYVAVRVFAEVDGRRTVVSHLAKHTRGLVARWLCEADRAPHTPRAVAALVAEHRECALLPDGRGGWFLDVLDRPGADSPS